MQTIKVNDVSLCSCVCVCKKNKFFFKQEMIHNTHTGANMIQKKILSLTHKQTIAIIKKAISQLRFIIIIIITIKDEFSLSIEIYCHSMFFFLYITNPNNTHPN